MRLPRLALLSAVAIVLTACSPGSGVAPRSEPSPSAGAPTTPAPATQAASPSEGPTPGHATRLEVRLTDTMRIEPTAMNVPVGLPVTFVVTNVGVLEHEFYLGDQEAQEEHELEMQSMGGMPHDDPEGIAVEPGETRELTYTFAVPGRTLAGCHVAGHYLAGMKADIVVNE